MDTKEYEQKPKVVVDWATKEQLTILKIIPEETYDSVIVRLIESFTHVQGEGSQLRDEAVVRSESTAPTPHTKNLNYKRRTNHN